MVLGRMTEGMSQTGDGIRLFRPESLEGLGVNAIRSFQEEVWYNRGPSLKSWQLP
jgi:hypothetical protein